jgi:hypothetical protein
MVFVRWRILRVCGVSISAVVLVSALNDDGCFGLVLFWSWVSSEWLSLAVVQIVFDEHSFRDCVCRETKVQKNRRGCEMIC